jgi:hypothetical protein
MTKFEKLMFDLGETKSYMQALELVECSFPDKGDAWAIQATDILLEIFIAQNGE